MLAPPARWSGCGVSNLYLPPPPERSVNRIRPGRRPAAFAATCVPVSDGLREPERWVTKRRAGAPVQRYTLNPTLRKDGTLAREVFLPGVLQN